MTATCPRLKLISLLSLLILLAPIISHPAPLLRPLSPSQLLVPQTTRVSPKIYGSSTCTSPSSSAPLITRHTQCPCFIRYIINSAVAATWDVFITPTSAFEYWKSQNYSNNPPSIVSDYSSLNTQVQGSQFLSSEDINAFIRGNFTLSVRARTEKRLCLAEPNITVSTSIVFEPIPTPCPAKIEENETLSKNAIPMQPRIVGGTIVNNTNTPNLFPWMASIWQNSPARAVCGGVQIAPGYIATAAHCHIHVNPSAFSVRLGTLQVDSGKLIAVRRAFVHPDYKVLDTKEAENDVAILELADTNEGGILEINHDSAIPKPGKYVTTAGFGYISEGWRGAPVPNRLQRVDVPVVSASYCKKMYKKLQPSIHLCAGYDRGGCDSCLSDSGGPLRYIYAENDIRKEMLVGLVSFGSGCARSKSPGVYTRVSAFALWMEQTVERAQKSRGGTKKIVMIVGGVAAALALVVLVAVLVIRTVKKGQGGMGEAEGPAVRESELSDMPSMTGVSG